MLHVSFTLWLMKRTIQMKKRRVLQTSTSVTANLVGWIKRMHSCVKFARYLIRTSSFG